MLVCAYAIRLVRIKFRSRLGFDHTHLIANLMVAPTPSSASLILINSIQRFYGSIKFRITTDHSIVCVGIFSTNQPGPEDPSSGDSGDWRLHVNTFSISGEEPYVGSVAKNIYGRPGYLLYEAANLAQRNKSRHLAS